MTPKANSPLSAQTGRFRYPLGMHTGCWVGLLKASPAIRPLLELKAGIAPSAFFEMRLFCFRPIPAEESCYYPRSGSEPAAKFVDACLHAFVG
jgi:hypothetical protein